MMDMLCWWLWVETLALLLLRGGQGVKGDVHLELRNSGPAILDVPIWFYADLIDFDIGSDEQLWWEWSDSLWNSKGFYSNGTSVSWNITYDSENYRDYTGEITITLKVEKNILVWITKASAETKFQLTGTLPGELTLWQPSVFPPKPGFISTINQTNITVSLYDYNDWLKQHTEVILFFWVITNSDQNPQCYTPSLIINITEPGDYIIRATVFLDLSDHLITTTTTTTTTTSTTTTTTTTPKPNTTTTTPKPTTPPPTTTPPTTTTVKPPTPNPKTWHCDGYWPQGVFGDGRRHKVGYFQTNFRAVEPIGGVNVTGSTWLKHGELVDLTVQCTGSPSIGHCKKTFVGVYNITGNESCDEDFVMTNTCNFQIVSYFQQNGTHTIVIIMFNDISKVIHPISINIYNVDRKPQLSYIIIPVSCSLVVIIIIVFGISYFIQSRNRYSVEVADFDFGASEETEYKTLFEQVKESLRQAVSGQDRDSEEDNKWRNRPHMVERPRILEEED